MSGSTAAKLAATSSPPTISTPISSDRGEALLAAVDQMHCGRSCTSVGSEMRMYTSFSSSVESLSSVIGRSAKERKAILISATPAEVGRSTGGGQQLEVAHRARRPCSGST